ncbi:DUF72 domain-containing protein [Asanoa iriomotensis]|uniref:Histidine kinase n=1 Tax=Asanoa iriomotensis TaxID=234613 RepID=A0ABQ4C479_9ACTN|nr:DUF72 domain-containing protein [Asanoa iriomotensis]GIF57570.1 histidine kinase [Asanoa iriomotensis]
MILVGTSGWQYRDWRGPFYPEKLPQKAWLAHYAGRFATVEVNNAFYRLPERDTFVKWREQTPDDFQIAVKMSRYLTHIRRLNDPAEPVKRFLDHADGLGDRLGPVLLQLPPNLKAAPKQLDAVLTEFPRTTRVAVEPRHESWWTDEVKGVLTDHAAALAWADRLGRPVTPLWRTAGWGYLRFHQGRATPRPRYGRSALRTWAGRLKAAFGAGADAFVYFNNDTGGAAVVDAEAFARQAAAAGLQPSRTP